MKKIFYILILILLILKSKGIDKKKIKIIDKEELKINYDENQYFKNKNRIYKIYKNTNYNIINGNFELKNGVLLTCTEKNKKYLKTDIECKYYLKETQGQCLFFRIKLPEYIKKFDSKIVIKYQLDKKEKIINTKLFFLFSKQNNNYYGFLIPYNLYWQIDRYKIDIQIYNYENYFIQIIENRIMSKKIWEEQIVYFKKKKSKEIATTDRKKFLEEKKERKNIWAIVSSNIYLNNGYQFPLLDLKYLTSEFGLIRRWKFYNGKTYMINKHTGVDYAALKGTNVYASCSGIVKYAKKCELIGNTIIIDHGLSFYTDYSHLNEILVKKGEYVIKGQLIGKVGSTGAATGPHLHWGARVYGFIVDPRSFQDVEKIFIP